MDDIIIPWDDIIFPWDDIIIPRIIILIKESAPRTGFFGFAVHLGQNDPACQSGATADVSCVLVSPKAS